MYVFGSIWKYLEVQGIQVSIRWPRCTEIQQGLKNNYLWCKKSIIRTVPFLSMHLTLPTSFQVWNCTLRVGGKSYTRLGKRAPGRGRNISPGIWPHLWQPVPLYIDLQLLGCKSFWCMLQILIKIRVIQPFFWKNGCLTPRPLQVHFWKTIKYHSESQ